MQFKIILFIQIITQSLNFYAQVSNSQKAKQLHDEQNYKQAVKLYSKIIDDKEANYLDYFYRGSANYELKNYQAAYNDLSASIGLVGDFSESYLLRGSLLVNPELVQDAINDFNMAIKYAKNDTVKTLAYISRAGSKLFTQNYESAMNDCFEALKIDSTSVRSRGAYVNLSTCYGYLKESEKSIQILKKMYLLDSNNVSTVSNLGYELTSMEKYQESLYYFDRALKLRPNDGFVLSNKSYAYLKLGKINEALRLIEKSIKNNPTNSYAYRNMGLIYMEMKDKNKACEAFQTALKKGFTDIYGNEVLKLVKSNCN